MSTRASVGVNVGSLDLDLQITVADGEVLAVLGPNGAGKSTLLRSLAGLHPVDRGEIEIDGATVDGPSAGVFVEPERRPVGLVFQDYLLFPHLDALDNVAFGLRARGRSRSAARAEATRLLSEFGLDAQAHLFPRQLSGGQAQRVALARALAGSPRLLLLDEPLSALDASAKAAVRRDLRARLSAFEGATVLVTHDPLDALALADHALVLEHGRVTQTGPIEDLADRPRTAYVAELLGINLFRGIARGTTLALTGGGHHGPVQQTNRIDGNHAVAELTIADPADGEVFALVRPAAVALHTHRPDGSARNAWSGPIIDLVLVGERIRVRVDGPLPIVAEVTPAAVAALDLHEGRTVWAAVKATEIDVYPA